MGADIHATIEYRHKGNGQRWTTFAALALDRNYHAFGYMAGVRSEFEPLVELRGLPSDHSLWPGYCDKCQGDDAWGEHSRGWLTTSEFITAVMYAQDRANQEKCWQNLTDYNAAAGAMTVLSRANYEVRIVFGFSS